MCVHKEVAHVLYLLLRQPIEESDTAGGDSAVQDTSKTETSRSLLKHGAGIACLDRIKHPYWKSDVCDATYANASKMVKRRLFL